MVKENKFVIGIDQSYNRTGIVVIDSMERGEFVDFVDPGFSKDMSNTEKRNIIKKRLGIIVSSALINDRVPFVVCERIRLFSSGKISQSYMEATGALIAAIIDALDPYKIPLYSVDTRTWKSAIVGTSKPMENRDGINPKKYPTIKYVQRCGHLHSILIPYIGRGKKGVIRATNGCMYEINDDLADAYCIARYGMLPEEQRKLKLEKF